jgi:hypothetical protein
MRAAYHEYRRALFEPATDVRTGAGKVDGRGNEAKNRHQND